MRDLSQRCLFSGSTNNLNTVMEITLEGEKYKVAISEEFEEEASPAAIKKRIPVRLIELEKAKAEMLAKMDEFKLLASELGFDLVKRDSGLVTASEQRKPKKVIDPTLSDKPTIQIGDLQYKMQKNTRQIKAKAEEAGMSAEEATAALEAAKRQSKNPGNASPAGGAAPRYAKHLLPESVAIRTRAGELVEVDRPEIYSKKLQTIKGRQGVPTTIPRSLQGSDGETTITIVDTGGDKTIQARAKQLGAMREMNDRSDYSQPCRPCQGTGSHAKRHCKTCDGTGFII